MIRRLVSRFMELLWSDKVRPFVWIYYVALFVWGLIGVIFTVPITYVLPVMGDVAYEVWVWLHVIGTSMVMSGLRIEDKVILWPESKLRNRLWRIAVQLQTTGHGCMFWVLSAYVLSAILTVQNGVATYGIVLVSPYVTGSFLLMIQGFAKSVTGRFN